MLWHLANKEVPSRPFFCVVCMTFDDSPPEYAIATYEGGKWIDSIVGFPLPNVAAWFYMPPLPDALEDAE